MLLINGQFPGPLIEANWGDIIQVNVHNKIDGPEEGTALHWHGLSQQKTPWYDGVPSVQQCPIAPGKSFTYSFQASNYGSSWYHSHYSAQYAGGLFGPMIIYGPVQKNVDYDYDLGPIILSDWYHDEYFNIVENIMKPGPGFVPTSDNNLIQGKGNFNCSLPLPTGATCHENAGLPKFQVKKGKKYRLRLINTSAEAAQKFTIDGHNMTVFANDFVPIKPYTTNVVTLGVGQRSDVVVTMDGTADAFWMRSFISKSLSRTVNDQQALALAAVYFQGADTKKTPKTQAQQWIETPGNDALTLTEPSFAIKASEPDVTLNITIDFHQNATLNNLFYMNNSSFRANYDHPLLLLANQGNTSYPNDLQWNVHNTGNAKTTRLIIRATLALSHPLHLHGHDFQVLAWGQGEWDGTITRPENPQRRDVNLFPELGSFVQPTVAQQTYLVLQFDQDNPGVWPFHCHIAWHVSQGLYINIMERPDDIKQHQIPGVMAQTCRDWAAYTGHTVVDQIDSGL